MTTCNLVALDDFGGLQTLYVSLAKRLAEMGAPPLTINRASNKPKAEYAIPLSTAGVEITSPRRSHLFRFGQRLESWPRLRQAYENAYVARRMTRFFEEHDVKRVVAWNAFPSAAYIPKGGDIILYDHGLSSNQSPHLLNREKISRARSVIAISRANQRLLQERWGWHGEIHVLPNPLRSEISTAAVKTDYWTGTRPFVVGAACRFVPFKGLASLIHAVAEVRRRGGDVYLRLAGSGPELGNLKKAVKSLAMQEYVSFEGNVSDMPRFYHGIDLLVAPSIREPFGLTPLEALACGIPAIMTEVDGHPEVLPFSDAATLIEPDLPLNHYRDLGSSLKKVPEYVFSPKRDCVVKSMALDPLKLADAIHDVRDRYGTHSATATIAARKIREKNAMDLFANAYLSLVYA